VVLGLFDLKWLILVQIPLYILTEMLVYLLPGPQQLLACILLAAEGTSRTPLATGLDNFNILSLIITNSVG